MIRRIVVALIAAVSMLAGCDVQDGTKANSTSRGADQRQLVLRGTSEELARMLYERNLISDPEVNRKMNEAVLQISRDGALRDSVMPVFLRWLEDWASSHPSRVEAARLISGAYTLEARRAYRDTDSSRRVQVDSIRRLVREGARRRIEATLAARKPVQLD